LAEQATPAEGEGRLVVGLVRGVHGLRGALRVELLSDDPQRFAPGAVLHREDDERPLTVLSAQRDGPGLLVRFAEVADRPAADSLRGVYLAADAPPLPAGTYYWHEIVGCAVVTTAGEPLGTVSEVTRFGESEVYIVDGPRGELLVPAVHSVVRELVPAERRLVVDAEALGVGAAGADEPAK